MARGRTTPIPAQLDRHLGQLDDQRVVMSALSLAEVFEQSRQQRDTTFLGQIHKALHRAWGAGKLISFIDVDGNVLREAEFGAPGSAAVEHPQLFATPGTESPQRG